MELANWTNPEFRDGAYRVFGKQRPRYPRPLTNSEIIDQIRRVPIHDLTLMAGQIGGGGKLSSQFLNYVHQCGANCWASWKDAWRDFAEFMGFTTIEHNRAMEEVFRYR